VEIRKGVGHRPAAGGFTLLELMISLAVVAILAAIGYPAYTGYVQRGKIVEALGQLSTVRVRLEQYYQDNRNYGSTATSCAVALPTGPYFTFTCNWGAVGTSQGYLLTATGNGAGGMDGFVFTVDETNAQRTTQFAGDTVAAACWLRKKGATC
jgi:type IV pilus assembly protein PilE